MGDDLVPTALPPDVLLMQLIFGKQITYSLAAMARLGIADHMGATPISIETLADQKNSARYRAMLRGDEWTMRAYEHFVDCVRTGEDGVTKAYRSSGHLPSGNDRLLCHFGEGDPGRI
jgi:hypothetical protein